MLLKLATSDRDVVYLVNDGLVTGVPQENRDERGRMKRQEDRAGVTIVTSP